MGQAVVPSPTRFTGVKREPARSSPPRCCSYRASYPTCLYITSLDYVDGCGVGCRSSVTLRRMRLFGNARRSRSLVRVLQPPGLAFCRSRGPVLRSSQTTSATRNIHHRSCSDVQKPQLPTPRLLLRRRSTVFTIFTSRYTCSKKSIPPFSPPPFSS